MVKVKVCGLRRAADVEAVNRCLPDYVGFVFAKSRRQVMPEEAAVLGAMLNRAICPVGVFVNEKPQLICELAARRTIRMVQLHGQESPEMVHHLKQRLSEVVPEAIPVIKAIRMDTEQSQRELRRWQESEADCLLLDSGAGGTGKRFDHRLLDAAEPIGKPWFLAGGLNPENVKEVLRWCAPWGVDVSSGVETEDGKDERKIEQFIRSVRHE